MPSIYEVATEAGVSASTVSRTFNTPHLINSKTKQRVLEVAQRMNYRPPRSRPSAVSHQHGTVPRETQVLGFQFFSAWAQDTLQGNPFYSQILAGALAEASDLGVRLVLSSAQRHGIAGPLPSVIRDESVAGLLMVGAADQQVVERFVELIPNVVFVDHRDPTGLHDSIVSDNFSGTREATNYLLGLGHRRIAFLTNEDIVNSFEERLNGYLCAHFSAGISVDPSLIVRRPLDEEMKSRMLHELVTRSGRPSAIIAANDEHAFSVMRVCYDAGVNIPNDLSLVGFDDIDFSAKSIPPLTSVRVPTEMLGRLGVRRLIARIADAVDSTRPALPSCSILPVTLVERQSCRPFNV